MNNIFLMRYGIGDNATGQAALALRKYTYRLTYLPCMDYFSLPAGRNTDLWRKRVIKILEERKNLWKAERQGYIQKMC